MKILYPDSISGYPDIRILYPDIRILYPKLVCFGYHFLENFPSSVMLNLITSSVIAGPSFRDELPGHEGFREEAEQV